MNADTKALLARLRHYGDNDRDAACALIESQATQLRAQAVIIEGMDRRNVHQGREVGALMQRAADVQGERDANAILTEQVERLEAERDKERAARQEAQRQLYAERERLYKLVSDEQVKASGSHAAMRTALEALERFNADMCAVVHHNPRDRHDIGDACPVYAKHEAAVTALRAALRKA